MRIDKFLKLSRLVKRRTLAQEMIEIGAVRLNGRVVKSSAELHGGERIEIAFPRRVLAILVLSVDERALKRGEPAASILEERRLSEDERPW